MADPRVNGEIRGDSFDEVFRDLLFYLSRYPDHVCSPRGQKIKEQLATTLVLENPRRRLITNPERKMNYGFSVGEFLWYWRGANDLESIAYYNARMREFSDDGRSLNSAYGLRMKHFPVSHVWAGDDGMWVEDTHTQWENVISTLQQDPDSRRAVIHVNRPEDQAKALSQGSKDVPCTMSLQFFVRDKQLHLHVLMRSNDAFWGLCSDAFSFTLFQECMLLELRKHPQFVDLELGTYYHTAGSIHIYERHFEQAERILKAYDGSTYGPEMGTISSLDDLALLVTDEKLLRLGSVTSIGGDYAGGLAWMRDRLNEHRSKRDASVSSGT